MGMEQTVVFDAARLPTWAQLAAFLAGQGFPLQLRMIDGELAFPNEMPPEDWRELRVSTPQGMVTLRRDAEGVTLITWGNADGPLRQAWNALTWAIAALTEGTVRTAEGDRSSAAFARAADLPPACRPGASCGG